MLKYRQKLMTFMVVNAERWTPTLDGRSYIPIPPVHHSFLVEKAGWIDLILRRPRNWYIRIPKGDKLISPGDWIICGTNGVYYPCKPDIFQETYELYVEVRYPDDKVVKQCTR